MLSLYRWLFMGGLVKIIFTHRGWVETDLRRSERVLNLLYMIQQRPGVQCNELAALFDRSPRTIQRDLKQLRKLGFAIRSSRGPAGGFAARGATT
ncbi:MAG: helix-turn-helix transcriptional regulator [Bacillota bacterium]